MLDSNTHYLNEYEINSVLLDKQWEIDLPNKQEAVVELAIKLIKQEADPMLFCWVFSDYLEFEDIDEVFLNDLEIIAGGGVTFTRYTIVLDALTGACQSLYDCELDEIVPHGVGGLIKQVLEGLK